MSKENLRDGVKQLIDLEIHEIIRVADESNSFTILCLRVPNGLIYQIHDAYYKKTTSTFVPLNCT